ncbi:MAG: YaaA family protein [Bacteroides sp.]|nr:YaaA family protein [Roseburia sp.]MCM1347705.1 YaaA family protein [Bacteroides sp.]MCM1421554.1 YaaA family protein [Bacteroides sp.]
MQILLACAKIMNDKPVRSGLPLTAPCFLEEAEAFARDMMRYEEAEIACMLNCSSQIAVQNKWRYQHFFDEDNPLKPALMAYHGQAYKHLKAETFTDADLSYADKHLWIVSFLYGLLRPSDGIRSYRLEGNVTLPSGKGQNMFGFWKLRLTDLLIEAVKADDGVLLHLATEEFQHVFDWKRVTEEVRVVQPLFYTRQGNCLKMQAVWAKSCRGAMTRFVVCNRWNNPEQLNRFSYEGFEYSPNLGEPDFPHFVRE